MSRGGWYRSPDGKGTVHLLFGRIKQAPGYCKGPALPGDDVNLFGGLCARIGGHLCDAPVGETLGGKPITCDASMCEKHRTHVHPDTDYCPKHSALALAASTAAMRLALLLLLFALPAQAATWTYNFEDAAPHHVAQAIGTVSGNGFTLAFGPAWLRAVDEDACSPPNGCVIPLNQGELGPWGDFANEPSGTCAGYTPFATTDESIRIYFTPPIRTLSFRYSGNYDWCPPETSCSGLGSLPAIVEALKPGNYYPQVLVAYLTETGSVGCTGDPDGFQCAWRLASYTFSEPVGSVRIGANWPGYSPFYVDDITVGDGGCAHPPCEFERATRAPGETPARRSTWGGLHVRYR